MSTETHPEAAGLAEALYDAKGFHAADSWATETAITRGWYEEEADVALPWLTARLTDDDVVEAAAEAMLQRHDWGRPAAVYYDDIRAALSAAAAVIGGDSDA